MPPLADAAVRHVRVGQAVLRRVLGEIDPADTLWQRAIAFATQWWPRLWLMIAGIAVYGLLVYLFATYGNTDFFPLLFTLRRVLVIVEVAAIVALVLFVGLIYRLRMEANDRHDLADASFHAAERAPVGERAPLLDAALADWRRALAVCPRPLAPREWGGTQFALARGAQARAALAMGEARETLLLEALVAYRASAESSARRSALTEWAQAQRAIGTTLREVAQEAPAQQRAHLYDEAASALHAALTTQSPQTDPRAWADTQIEIARTWQAAAESAEPPERARQLGEAAACLRLALPVYARHASRPEWAELQHALGTVLIQQAAEVDGVARVPPLDEALVAYREALSVTTRWVNAGVWAALQAEVGAALRLRAQVATEAMERLRLLDAAVGALDSALEVRTREEFPAQWAATEATLGSTLLDASSLYAGPERMRVLEEAAATLDAAARALSVTGALAAANATRVELARAEGLLAESDGGPQPSSQA